MDEEKYRGGQVVGEKVTTIDDVLGFFNTLINNIGNTDVTSSLMDAFLTMERSRIAYVLVEQKMDELKAAHDDLFDMIKFDLDKVKIYRRVD